MMKTNLLSAAFFLALGTTMLFFLGCSEGDEPEKPNIELTGKWELIEILSDPGDGSGTFHETDFYKTIEFFNDGKIVITNGNLCNINVTSTEIVTETYTIDGNSIITDSCEGVDFEFESSDLIIWQLCIEGCGEKYKRVN